MGFIQNPTIRFFRNILANDEKDWGDKAINCKPSEEVRRLTVRVSYARA